MLFERVKTRGIAHNAYVIGDAREAAVVDPRRERGGVPGDREDPRLRDQVRHRHAQAGGLRARGRGARSGSGLPVGSCYAPGDPLDRLCRTDGVRELRFLSRDLEDAAPLVAHQPATATRTQVVPDDSLAAVELLPLYLARRGGTLRASDHATPRWITAAGEEPGSDLLPDLVQPLEGQGPWWLASPRITDATLR